MAAANELVVRSELTAVRRTRRFARRIAERLGAEADTLELLVSELVTNAVLHGAPPIKLRIEMLRDRVHVAVADANPRLPLMRPQAEGLTGRGLAIVEALSEGWGALPRPDGGKVVWADVAPLRLRERS